MINKNQSGDKIGWSDKISPNRRTGAERLVTL
jgi:hypothetical protein